MEENIKKAVETYQCPGCSLGGDTSCYEKSPLSDGCRKHSAGTSIGTFVKFFLGMPKGFNRPGVSMHEEHSLKIDIFRSFDEVWDTPREPYDKWNIPVWKHLDENGHTLVRGLSPRNNSPFLHVILENCMDRIDCFEVSEQMIDEMD
jgi:hypothetical protein